MIFFTILLFRLQVIASGLIVQPLVTLVHSRDPKLEPENIPMRSELKFIPNTLTRLNGWKVHQMWH